MPAQQITFVNKDKNGTGAATLWRDIDANSVKTVVNAHAADIDTINSTVVFVSGSPLQDRVLKWTGTGNEASASAITDAFTGGNARMQGTFTGNRIFTFPNVSDTIVTNSAAATLTNKTLSGSDNTFSNIPKSAVGLSSVDDVQQLPLSYLDTDTALAANSDTKVPSQKAIKTYVDNAVVGLLDDRGSYDASVNLFPSTGGSGTAGAIMKGDMWFISGAGTLGGEAVSIGDSIRALSDTPGQTPSNWSIIQVNIQYVPENITNKDTDGTLSANSDTLYASQKAVKTYADNLKSKTETLTNKTYRTVDSVISASDIDWSSGNSFHKTLTGNTTFTFSNDTDGQTIVVAIKQSSGGGNTAGFPAGVLWTRGTPPIQTTTANKTDVYTFVKINGVVYGSFVQNF